MVHTPQSDDKADLVFVKITRVHLPRQQPRWGFIWLLVQRRNLSLTRTLSLSQPSFSPDLAEALSSQGLLLCQVIAICSFSVSSSLPDSHKHKMGLDRNEFRELVVGSEPEQEMGRALLPLLHSFLAHSLLGHRCSLQALRGPLPFFY
ncbi:hypothetical protein YC2023_029066 [Brassica napus]